ncbi:MAG: hypothetical protein ACI9XB_003909, partial [Gammaproteobacteria bacterium]
GESKTTEAIILLQLLFTHFSNIFYYEIFSFIFPDNGFTFCWGL